MGARRIVEINWTRGARTTIPWREYPGAVGDSVIEIDENGARFIETAGADKSCIEQGYIRDAGEMAVCVPNRVLMRVIGKSDIDTDFISR